MPTNIKAHCGAIDLDTGTPIEETFLDNGDGTYARLMGASGTVTIGEVVVADGGDEALGATTDASSASTVIGLLKSLKAAVETNHYTAPSAGASVSVGTSSTAVLAANSSRVFLALCNDSANVIYVDLSGATAVASKGIRLNANGGSLVLDRYVPRTAIKAIASGAGSVLTVQEA